MTTAKPNDPSAAEVHAIPYCIARFSVAASHTKVCVLSSTDRGADRRLRALRRVAFAPSVREPRDDVGGERARLLHSWCECVSTTASTRNLYVADVERTSYWSRIVPPHVLRHQGFPLGHHQTEK